MITMILTATELAEWFQAHAMPYVLTFATTLTALITVLTPFITAVRRLRKNSDVLTKSNASVLAENALIQAENKQYKAKIAEVQKNVGEIKEMCRIAFLNDERLVKNGYAKQIAEIIGETEEVMENGEDETQTDEP